MTIRKLLDYFEGYYGEKYTGVFLEVMTAYLDGYPEKFLDAIAKVVVEKFPRHFNKSPDPAIIEENLPHIRREWESEDRDMNDTLIMHLKKTIICLMEMLKEGQEESVNIEILELKQGIDKLLRAAHENPDYKFNYSDIQLFHKMDVFFKQRKSETEEDKQ